MTDSSRTCPWEILGVSPWDDAATIRKAWLALVRWYHPDLARNDREAANRRLADINNAFDVVSDPEATKRKIDELRRAAAARRAAAGASGDANADHADRRQSDAGGAEPAAADRPRDVTPQERRRAQTARDAFHQALRVLDGGHGPRGSVIYL